MLIQTTWGCRSQQASPQIILFYMALLVIRAFSRVDDQNTAVHPKNMGPS